MHPHHRHMVVARIKSVTTNGYGPFHTIHQTLIIIDTLIQKFDKSMTVAGIKNVSTHGYGPFHTNDHFDQIQSLQLIVGPLNDLGVISIDFVSEFFDGILIDLDKPLILAAEEENVAAVNVEPQRVNVQLMRF